MFWPIYLLLNARNLVLNCLFALLALIYNLTIIAKVYNNLLKYFIQSIWTFLLNNHKKNNIFLLLFIKSIIINQFVYKADLVSKLIN